MKMRAEIAGIVITLLTVLACFGPRAVAQDISDDPRIEMIRLELVRTERLIQQVAEAIHPTANPIAAVTLQKAREIQAMARKAFRQGTPVGYRTAATLTMKARELAKAALANSRQTDQFEGAVARKLERAENLLMRAREAVGQSPAQELRVLFEAARNNLQRGWEFYRNKRYRPAVKLADQVEKAAERILHAATSRESSQAQFERHWERISQRLADLGLSLEQCRSENAALLLRQAEKALEAARELSEAGRWGKGLRVLLQARSFARRVAEACQGGKGLEQRFRQLQAEADRLGRELAALEGSRKQAAEKLMEQVRDQLTLAAEYLGGGQLEAARASLQGAQLALRQVKKLIGAAR